MTKENILILISCCTKIMNIFLGPFLVAYFIKISADSIIDISLYKIIGDFLIVALGFLVAYVIKKNHGLAMFRVGVILNFIYILSIILLKEDIINHLGYIAFMFGFSTIAFWHPYNLFNIYLVENNRRTVFEANKKLIGNIISILIPIVLGALITTTNYQITAIIVLIFAFIQILCSFGITSLPKYNSKFNITETWNKVKQDKRAKKVLTSEFLSGLCIHDGAISVIITIFIIESFKNDINLGAINSISAIIALLFLYLYSRYIKPKDDKKIVWISCIIIVLSSILLVAIKSPATIVIYNIIFEVFAIGILQLIEFVRIDNFNKQMVSHENINEFMMVRECFLNLGRAISFMLLIIIDILGVMYLNYIFILLNVMIITFGIVITKLERFE